MRSRFLFAAIVVVMGSTSALLSQEPAQPKTARPEASLFTLRNAAAADVSKTLTQYAQSKKMLLAVAAEPASNSVLVAGDPSFLKELTAIIEKLDNQPPQVVLQLLIFQAPIGFDETCGLAEKREGGNNPERAAYELTARESRMFQASLRELQKQGQLDVLSRPQLTCADNQTGYFQVGQTIPVATPNSPVVAYGTGGIMARCTPRVTSDGVLIRLEMSRMETNGKKVDVQSTVKTQDGGTTVIRGPRSGDNSTEIYLVVTPHVVRNDRK